VFGSNLSNRSGAADEDGAAGPPPDGPLSRARYAFRHWRRTRPFWGGLLVVLGAAEILVSEHAPLPVVIHIGLQGLAGYLIPAILLLIGLLLWFNPVQRTFYSLLAVVLALGSWITSNLGGFFVGMLLGVVGGSLAFAWTSSGDPGPAWRPPWHKPAPKEPSEGLDLILGGPHDDADAAGDETDEDQPLADDAAGDPPNPRSQSVGSMRVLPAGPLSLALLAVALHQGPLASALAPARPPVASAASPSPKLRSSAKPKPSPTRTATPRPTPGRSRSGSAPGPTPSRHVPHLVARGPGAATAVSSLSAGLVSVTGLSFDGIAKVPTAAGGVQMLKFSMSSMAFSDGSVLTYAVAGRSVATSAASIDLSGDIVLYTTMITGELNGKKVIYSVKHPPTGLSADMTLTDVVADQPYASADSFVSSGLKITVA